ncbi:MAG: hypothetical protein SGILL_005671 [Bacillariaceae sp.]
MGTVDVTEQAQRDVYPLQQWAEQYGAQTAPGVELTTQDGADWFLMANQNIGAGQPVLFVPSDIILSSFKVEQEFGGNLISAEEALTRYEGTAQRLPLFRLMVKILAEYEKGQESPYFTWMNALPRQFFNGAAMTEACFDCLPPYAASLAMAERNTYSRFLNALRQGYLPLSQQTLQDDNLIKWAYNVALTRFNEIWEPRRQKLIAPLGDMFNHASNPNVVITFDRDGNFMATAVHNIEAGSQLSISLGDPSNPTPLFAKYGFLYNDTPTIFCKAMHLEDVIETLGYDFKDLLFQTQTGDISPQVWDIFLYRVLQENDQNTADQFYVACKTNDEGSKQEFHGQYFAYTLQALKAHVDNILHDIDRLSAQAQSYNPSTHPRVPVILAHNNLVRDTFMKVQQQLNAMG